MENHHALPGQISRRFWASPHDELEPLEPEAPLLRRLLRARDLRGISAKVLARSKPFETPRHGGHVVNRERLFLEGFHKWGVPLDRWMVLVNGKIPSFEMEDEWGYPVIYGNPHMGGGPL